MSRNIYKLVVSCILIFVVLVFLCRCSLDKNSKKTAGSINSIKIIMVTDQAGLGDQGFNDSGWSGASRAAKNFGLKADFIESGEQADYVPNLSIAARKADVVIAMGYLMKDAVAQVAPLYPKTSFIFIDGKIEIANVASYDFKGEEATFLAGFIAADVSRNKKLGVINGMDIPPVIAYEYGFRSGVAFANKILNTNVTVSRLTVGSFDDPVKGKSLARNLLGSGHDIILQIAGNSGIGVIELFKQVKTPEYLISSDIDIEDMIPGRVLTCVMKRFDNAVYNAVSDYVKGNFKTGYHIIGLREDAVGITGMRHTSSLVSRDIMQLLDTIKLIIKENGFKVPSDKAEFSKADFKALAQKVSRK
jgi:basic membrane protein A